MLSARQNCTAASWPRLVHTCVPNSAAGLSDLARISASFSMSAGSPTDLVEARYAPGFGMRARSMRHFGVEHVAWDFQIYRAGRTVDRFAKGHGNHVGDAFGVRHGGGELGDRRHDIDVRQILQRAHACAGESAPCPPIINSGLSARNALAMPVMALVVPGPAVVTTQPILPLWRE